MNAAAGIRGALSLVVGETVLRVRQRWRTAASRAARLTGAAVASYGAAEALLPGT